MTEGDSGFTGSIPEFYDTYLVPLIFEAYAGDLAERVVALAPETILETAAGSGVVTRSVASRMASDVHYTVTDLNQPMLDHAAKRQGVDGASHGVRRTRWTCHSMTSRLTPLSASSA